MTPTDDYCGLDMVFGVQVYGPEIIIIIQGGVEVVSHFTLFISRQKEYCGSC